MWTSSLFLIYTLHLQIILAKHSFVFLNFGNCNKTDENSIFHFENNQWGMVSPSISEFNTTVVLTRDFDVVTAKIIAYKCKSTSERDCEIMMTVPVGDVCKRTLERGQFWSFVSEAAHPPITCPLKKGRVQISHARVNLKLLENLMEDDVIYMVKFPGDWHGTYTGCLMVQGKTINVKNRRKP